MSGEKEPKVHCLQWDTKSMEAAMKAVMEGEKVASAAKLFKVPRKSLDNCVKGRVEHGKKPGPGIILTREEEEALAAYLLYMADQVFPLTTKYHRPLHGQLQ